MNLKRRRRTTHSRLNQGSDLEYFSKCNYHLPITSFRGHEAGLEADYDFLGELST